MTHIKQILETAIIAYHYNPNKSLTELMRMAVNDRLKGYPDVQKLNQDLNTAKDLNGLFKYLDYKDEVSSEGYASYHKLYNYFTKLKNVNEFNRFMDSINVLVKGKFRDQKLFNKIIRELQMSDCKFLNKIEAFEDYYNEFRKSLMNRFFSGLQVDNNDIFKLKCKLISALNQVDYDRRKSMSK